jgi:hypothetical protein
MKSDVSPFKIINLAYYKNNAIEMPKRHYLNRFVRDFRQWTEKYVDHMHYTVPLTCSTGD